jgi:ribosomal protein L11 methyltransferase
MPFLQLVIDAGPGDPAPVEEACFSAGALSVTLTDAADDPVLEPAPGATPLWPAVRVSALFPAGTDGAAVTASLAVSLGLPSHRILAERVEDQAWEREWLKDFRPMRFGRRLWIAPGGQEVAEPGAVVLELDPGLAFGTGTHATTAMCLEWLDNLELGGRRVLDFGCGSGVLALAALRLGAQRAVAVDIDPQALAATQENAARNGLGDAIHVLHADALPEGCWDVVLANILAGPLVRLAPRIAAATCEGGRLLLAGLLDEQAPDVAAAYRPWFHMQAFAARDGWTALTGRKSTE